MKLGKIFSALKYLNWATIALYFSKKGSLKKYLGESRFSYYTQKQLGLPVVKFFKIFPRCQDAGESICIIAEEKTGGLSALELQYLSSIVKCYPIKSIFEIGTFDGCAATHMILNSQSPDQCIIFTLDLPDNNTDQHYSHDPGNKGFLELRRPGYYIEKYVEKGVTQLFCDSQKFDFDPYFNTMDLVFIDGNHNMPFIQKDTENALKMLKPNGIIIWHDYFGVPGEPVTDYLNQLSQKLQIIRIEKTCFAIYQKNENNR